MFRNTRFNSIYCRDILFKKIPVRKEHKLVLLVNQRNQCFVNNLPLTMENSYCGNERVNHLITTSRTYSLVFP